MATFNYRKITNARFVGLLILLNAAVALSGAQPKDLSPLLQSILSEHHDMPGMVAAIVDGDQVTAIGAAGVRKSGSTVPMKSSDLIHLGSDTKAMTATLIGQLIEAKRLTFQTTLAETFPNLRVTMNPDMAKVTVSQLLTHTSGLKANLNWSSFAQGSASLVVQRRKVVEEAVSTPPDNPPGSKYEYSNLGFVVLGAIIEQKTGKPWEDVIRERLFVPLGMSSAGFGPPGARGAIDQPWGHVIKDSSLVPLQSDNPPVMSPAGRVHCSIADWAKFVSVFVGSGKPRVLSRDMINRLTSPGKVGDYNGGWIITDRPWAGGKALTHAGSNTMWFCVVWAAPKRNFAVLVATNVAGKGIAEACDKTVGALIRVHEGK